MQVLTCTFAPRSLELRLFPCRCWSTSKRATRKAFCSTPHPCGGATRISVAAEQQSDSTTCAALPQLPNFACKRAIPPRAQQHLPPGPQGAARSKAGRPGAQSVMEPPAPMMLEAGGTILIGHPRGIARARKDDNGEWAVSEPVVAFGKEGSWIYSMRQHRGQGIAQDDLCGTFVDADAGPPVPEPVWDFDEVPQGHEKPRGLLLKGLGRITTSVAIGGRLWLDSGDSLHAIEAGRKRLPGRRRVCSIQMEAPRSACDHLAQVGPWRCVTLEEGRLRWVALDPERADSDDRHLELRLHADGIIRHGSSGAPAGASGPLALPGEASGGAASSSWLLQLRSGDSERPCTAFAFASQPERSFSLVLWSWPGRSERPFPAVLLTSLPHPETGPSPFLSATASPCVWWQSPEGGPLSLINTGAAAGLAPACAAGAGAAPYGVADCPLAPGCASGSAASPAASPAASSGSAPAPARIGAERAARAGVVVELPLREAIGCMKAVPDGRFVLIAMCQAATASGGPGWVVDPSNPDEGCISLPWARPNACIVPHELGGFAMLSAEDLATDVSRVCSRFRCDRLPEARQWRERHGLVLWRSSHFA